MRDNCFSDIYHPTEKKNQSNNVGNDGHNYTKFKSEAEKKFIVHVYHCIDSEGIKIRTFPVLNTSFSHLLY